MATQQYQEIKFKSDTLALIGTLNGIVKEYVAAGYMMTVRQMYYQMIARDLFPSSWIDTEYNRKNGLEPTTKNTVKNYKRFGNIINDAKMAGLTDWDAIEDRTRAFIRRTRWDSAGQIVRSAADSFHMDMWVGQEYRVFVIVEKEALAGVLERPCHKYDVPLLAARGYPSGTVLREFALSDLQPCFDKAGHSQTPIILHLGDHDPSGMDMSRDMAERFYTFITGKHGGGKRLNDEMFNRIALNIKQVKTLKLPPNPAKTTDARFNAYRDEHGVESWELDALEPDYLDKLVTANIVKHINISTWSKRSEYVEKQRKRITKVADDFGTS